MKPRAVLLSLCVAGVMCLSVAAQQPQPDNTKTNQRDRSATATTAGKAGNSAMDRELMQKIRKSLIADKSLSTYAHNVKVVAQSGKVTLKGPVRSEEEKRTVEAKAAEVAGAGNVVNDLSIKPAKTSSK